MKIQHKPDNHPLLFILLGILVSLIFSCSSSPEAIQKKSRAYFDRGEYELSLQENFKIIEKKYQLSDNGFLAGESYRLSNRLDKSIPYYNMALEAGNPNPMIYYYLAFAHKNLGEYDAERENLTKFLATKPRREYQLRAELELINLKKIPELTDKENSVKIQELKGNTKNSEFSPQWINGQLVISTSQKKAIYQNNGQPFIGLYSVNLASPTEIESTHLYSEAIFKENANEGTPAFSKDGKTIIFARGNTGLKGDREVNVDLYISKKLGSEWTKPEKLPISDSLAWDGTPCFSSDGKTLYFSSDRRGGKGGLDLYRVSMDNSGRFGRPINMGSQINTPGDESFPYISEDGKLYFSSNGHAGLGGLDLFVATRNDGEIIIEHLGVPMNSTGDDFGIVEIDGNHGYFSSNRVGGSGDDDIYYYEGGENVERWWTNDPIPEPETSNKRINYSLVAQVVDPKNKPLKAANIDIVKNGEKFLKVESDIEGNSPILNLEEMDAFGFKVQRKNYLTRRAEFKLEDHLIPEQLLTKEVTDTTFKVKIVLNPLEIGMEVSSIINLNPILYDLDKADIRPDAAFELDKIIEFLNDNPAIQLELGSHTDSRASNAYNLRLSQKRAESAVSYITSKGIDSSRITAKGYGETKLLNGCENGVDCTEEQHQENRRTEFIITDILEE